MNEINVALKDPKDFDISLYSPYTFHISKRNINCIYYKCKRKADFGCGATAKANFNDKHVAIKFSGEHNHICDPSKKTKKEIRNNIKDQLRENPDKSPAEIITKITSNLTNDELHDIRNVPTRKEISNLKFSYIHSTFPSTDHLWNALVSHGCFDGATKFIKFFSLVPFIIIAATEEGLLRTNQKNGLFLIDTTHSVCSPSLHLTTAMYFSDSNSGFYLLIYFNFIY